MQTLETLNQTAAPVKSDKPDFGNGRYSVLMEEVYADAQTVFGIDAKAAEKLARQVASELGAIMAKCPVEIRLGKLPKKGDAKITIREASTMKGVTVTNHVMALKALHYAGEAGKNGFSFAKTEWSCISSLQEFLNTL